MAHPDPHRASVVLELLCDGANNSTTFTDTSPVARTVTANGGAKISTAGFRLGTGHALFSTSGDFLSCANSADFYPSSGDFCVDGWIHPTSLAAVGQVAGYANGSAANTNYAWALNLNTNGSLTFNCYVGSTAYSCGSAASTVPLNTWTYFLASKAGTNLKMFVGGAQGPTTGTISGTINNPSSSVLNIGRLQGVNQFFGRLLLRVTKGQSRYTAAFTPAGYFEEGRSKLAGTVFDNAGAPVSRGVKIIRSDDWTVCGAEASNATTGAWEIWSPAKEDIEHRIIRIGSDSPLEQDVIERAFPVLPS